MAAIILVLWLTLMFYLDFQGDTVPDNFHVSAALFKIMRECRNGALQIHRWKRKKNRFNLGFSESYIVFAYQLILKW